MTWLYIKLTLLIYVHDISYFTSYQNYVVTAINDKLDDFRSISYGLPLISIKLIADFAV